ncbi:hypothetical protein ACOMNI_06155 [Lactobacillus gasseri]|uniref:hypothetical protein n=1 Tax=Lactobacillus gasseri TaxID=1596 RepID=UPI003B773838
MKEKIKHFIDIILGRNIIGNDSATSYSHSELENNIIKISHHSYKIDDDIFTLLYFTDGKYKNIDFQRNEPSAISMKWSISTHLPQKLGYYPSLSNATPAQRNGYLKWLSDNLPSDADIGYFFILLNCIERHIVNHQKVDECVSLLSRLINLTNNDSFKYYASASIAYVYFQLDQKDIISNLNLDKCLIELKIIIQQKLSTTDLIKCARQVGFTNKRYIKAYPDIFNDKLVEVLKEKFGEKTFPCNFNNPDTMPKKELHFSNISIRDKAQSILIPDSFSNEQFKEDINYCLQQAHNKVKLLLKTKRSSHIKSSTAQSSSPYYSYVGATLKSDLPSYITSIKIKVLGKKRVNVETGYPVSTDKQIVSTYDSLILIQDKSQSNPELLKYMDPGTLQKDMLLDYILPRFEKGLLSYRLGQWDKAEKEWLKLIYLMPHAIDKLGILYRKEKRYYDIVLITREATKSKAMSYLYNKTFTKKDIAKAMTEYKKHQLHDLSCLSENDLKNIKEIKEN